MRNLVFTLLFAVLSLAAAAQKVYFVYLQSDNNSAFYIKLKDRIYSSASSGYLILSNLADSTYQFSLGFPASPSESRFRISLEGRDKGFLIKNFQTGLGLFDLQTLTITNAQKEETSSSILYQKRNDDFSYMLSKAANDTSLLYAVVRTKEEPVLPKDQSLAENSKTNVQDVKDNVGGVNKDTVVSDTKQSGITEAVQKDSTGLAVLPAEIKKDSLGAISANEGMHKEEGVAPIAKSNENSGTVSNGVIIGQTIVGDSSIAKPPDTAAVSADHAMETVDSEVYRRSSVKKYSESSTSEGFGLVYYDRYEKGVDTIRLLIPNPPISFKTQEQDSVVSDKAFIKTDEINKDTVKQMPIVVAVSNNTPLKAQCKSAASTNDFFKLRKNMATENTDEGMVAEAKKIFKSKCFTTEQIKSLSALFLTSAGKYQFFDAAYLHVSDQEHFASLESEIKDDYYSKRFKALIGE